MILLSQCHPLIRVLCPRHPRLHREHEQASGGVLAPPLLGGDQLPELGGADLERGPLKPGGVCLGSLVARGLHHPIHGLGLVVEHGEQPLVGAEGVALCEQPERRATADREDEAVLGLGDVEVIHDAVLDVVLGGALLGGAVERMVAEVGGDLRERERRRRVGRVAALEVGEETEAAVVEAYLVQVRVLVGAEAVHVRGGRCFLSRSSAAQWDSGFHSDRCMAARPQSRDLSSSLPPSYTIRFPGAGVPPRILGIKSARDRIRLGAGFPLGLGGSTETDNRAGPPLRCGI